MVSNSHMIAPIATRPTLFLFSTDIALAVSAVANGVDYIIVDWERGEKYNRQAGTGFQIGQDTVEDVKSLAIVNKLPVFVRINSLGRDSKNEIAEALHVGAKGIMLPMAQNREEVSRFLDLIPKGVKTLIQIETGELAANPLSICDLPWDFVHVGLNDLMLSRKAPSIWTAVIDGTVERICESLDGRFFGFGGITVVNGGAPIPARLIILEMVRLGCSMGILRRSFTADIVNLDLAAELTAIRNLFEHGSLREDQAEELDRLSLINAIRDSGG